MASVDCRGVLRGMCLCQGCSCSCYSWDQDSGNPKCTRCDHVPGKHKVKNSPPASLRRYSGPGCDQCSLPGCHKPKWVDENGVQSPCCSRGHLQEFQSTGVIPPHLQCPGCGRQKYDKGDGTYFDYCGKSCRDLHQQQLLHSERSLSLGIQGGIYIREVSGKAFAKVSDIFQRKWDTRKGNYPAIDCILSITNSSVRNQWDTYRSALQSTNVEEHFHGTILSCNIVRTRQLCLNPKCGICGISKTGFDPMRIGSHVDFQRFGYGFYLAPNSSKCHDYTEGSNDVRAMLLCEVCPGNKFERTTKDPKLTAPPRGYDSVYGKTGVELNYEEITVYKSEAILPKYIIVYTKDGVDNLL